jgi:hypothetical protein
MAKQLTWAIIGGVVIGAAIGRAAGNTGIAICIAAGAIAVGLWHLIRTGK